MMCGPERGVVTTPSDHFTTVPIEEEPAMRQKPSRAPSPRQVSLAGQRFGRWFVLCRSPREHPGGKAVWICRCDCGSIRDVVGSSLRSGRSNSCGCLSLELTRERIVRQNTTHGMTNTPEWRSWASMLGRCYNSSHRNYSDYGGSGISVCDLWRFSFADFFRDMGPRLPGTTLDRIDFRGHYAPRNCRWATPVQQNRNRSNVRWIEYEGRTMTVRDWAEITGLTATAIYQRLNEGWPIHIALTKPLVIRNHGHT